MHTAATTSNALVLLMSPTQRQSSELLKKGRAILNKAEIPIRPIRSSTSP